MMKLEVFENDKELLVIDSREVAEMIGKSHGDLLTDIDGRKDGKGVGIRPTLEKGNFHLSNFFIESTYKAGNRSYKCYLLTKKGCEMIGNKQQGEKGILFTARYIEKFEQLEQENLELKEDYLEVSEIAKSDEDTETRIYNTKLNNYSWKRIRTMLESCDYRNIEDTVEDIIDFHTTVLKKKDRCNYDTHNKANNTEYKQLVRDHVYKILDSIYDNSRDSLLTMVVSNVKEELIKQRLATTNRSVGKIISNQENKIDEIEGYLRTFNPSIAEYNKIDCHGFSCNSTLQAVTDYNTGKPRVVNSNGYKNWIERFPNHQFKDYSEIDFNKKVYIWLKWDCLERFDAGDNFIKTFKDQLCRYHNVDDRNIMIMRSDVNNYVDSYDEGKIYYILKQGK